MENLTNQDKRNILNNRLNQLNSEHYNLNLNVNAIELAIKMHEDELAKYPDDESEN